MKKAIDALREYYKYYKASQAIDNLQNETIIEHADRLDALEAKKANPDLDALIELATAVRHFLLAMPTLALEDARQVWVNSNYRIISKEYYNLKSKLAAYEAAKEE